MDMGLAYETLRPKYSHLLLRIFFARLLIGKILIKDRRCGGSKRAVCPVGLNKFRGPDRELE
jgi:hypothetical protein